MTRAELSQRRYPASSVPSTSTSAKTGVSPVTDSYNRTDGSPYTGPIERVTILAGDDALPADSNAATRTVMSTQ